MLIQPRLITANPGLNSWQAVESLTYNKNAFAVGPNHNPNAELSYITRYMLTIQDTLPAHQRKLIHGLAEQERRRPHAGPVKHFDARDIKDITRYLDPNYAGLINTVCRENPKFSDIMMKLGLAWFYRLSFLDNPEINLDQLSIFSERAHRHPHQALLKVGRTTDPVERSRLSVFLNRWINLRTREDGNFHFTLSKKYFNLRGIDFSHLDLADLNAHSVGMEDAILMGARLLAADLSASNLDRIQALGAELSRAKLYESKIRDADLRHTRLIQVDARGSDFSGSDLTGAGLLNVSLAGAKLDRTKLGSESAGTPLITEVNSGIHRYHLLLAYTDSDVEQHTLWRQAEIFNTKFRNSSLVDIDFDETTFTNVTFENTHFARCSFKNCTFKGNITFESCSFAPSTDLNAIARAAKKATITLINPTGLDQRSSDWLKRAGVIIKNRPAPPQQQYIAGCRK